MTYPTPTGAGRFVLDLAERAVKSGVQAFLATLVAGGWFSVDAITDLSIPQKAGVAALVAALSVVSSAVSKFVGNRDSASVVV